MAGSTAAPSQPPEETDVVDAATGGTENLAAGAVELLEARQKIQSVSLWCFGFIAPSEKKFEGGMLKLPSSWLVCTRKLSE